MVKEFKFSIIMAVYNVEKYLHESVESVINQTIGFKENVQLILVDDGSSDNSKRICLYFQKKFPENIIVLSKENEGQSFARNLGLKHATGNYFNFLDSDDKLSLNALETIDNFIKNHEDINILAIPLKFFNVKDKEHPLNNKFEKEQIINVFENYNYPQLSASSCFFNKNIINDNEFDTQINLGEDAVFINKLLVNEKNIAFLNTTDYLYRKRDDSSSTLDDIGYKKEFYLDKLRYFHEELIKFSLDQLGYVAKFIQYVIAYDLQWYYGKSQIKEILSEEEYENFMKKLQEILGYIDEEIILNHEYIPINDKKKFLLFLKNNCQFNIDVKGNLVVLKTKDHVLNKLNNNKLWITGIDVKKRNLLISGKFSSYCKSEYLKIKAIKNMEKSPEEFIAEYNEELSRKTNCLGIDWKYVYCFDFEIPMEKQEEFDLSFIVNYIENDNDSEIKGHLKFEDYDKIFRNDNNLIKKSKKIFNEKDLIYIEDYPFKKRLEETLEKYKR
ncbi:glycosyltransferase [Methanobrevibacter sp.]|uniref:glycosyltransferase family 2 protein n=1 Tax=Methanobrevibacter sp. TaxID=66852 RepID=UPI0025E4ADF2|nr:glycosyltransferase [Methanobrevibacter sp.]MBQ2666053.1 glycosyltransferase [Methanobrevibacter sp.]